MLPVDRLEVQSVLSKGYTLELRELRDTVPDTSIALYFVVLLVSVGKNESAKARYNVAATVLCSVFVGALVEWPLCNVTLLCVVSRRCY
jgi:hypothetical protein